MSAALLSGRPVRLRRSTRVRRLLVEAGSLTLGAVLLIWWLLPIYNMVLIALDPQGTTEFAGNIIPPDPSWKPSMRCCSRATGTSQDFWHQFGNSIYIGIMTMALNVAIGSAASFALGRMRLSRGWVSSNAALLVYAVPAYFLVIPFYRLMHSYGLMDNLWSVIAVDVVFESAVHAAGPAVVRPADPDGA